MRRDITNSSNGSRGKFLKIGSITVCFVFVMMAMAAFIAIFPTASANPDFSYTITFSGDLPPDGLTYFVYAYNQTQASPLDGLADTGTYKFNGTGGGVTGDTSYTNNDWSFTVTVNDTTGQNVYMYTGTGGGTPADLKIVVPVMVIGADDHDTTDYIDFCKIQGTTHADIEGTNVTVADEFGSTKLNNLVKAVAGDGGYSQYYFTEEEVDEDFTTNNDVYIIFSTESSPTTTWNSSKKLAKRIDVPESYDSYGVYPQYDPQNKLVSDIHTNLAGATFKIDDNTIDSGKNLGMSYIAAADGLNDTNDDTPTYYDNISSGNLIMCLEPTTATNTTIDPEVNDFSNQDTTVKLNGTVPYDESIGDDIQEVKTVIGAKTYKTTPNATGYYTLYIPDNVTSITLQFAESAGGASVFNKTLSIHGINASAGSQDKNVSLARLYGMTHSDLEANGSCEIDIYNDTTFSTEVSDSTIQIAPYLNVWLDDYDYEIYYEVTYGDTSFYPKLNMEGSNYTTYCVATPNSLATISGGTTTLKNYTVSVNGTVPSDIDKVEIDLGQDGTNESYSTSFNSSGVYHIFTVNGTDNTSAVLFYNSTTNGLVLNRTKNLNLTQSSVKFDVAKLSGSIKGTFTPDDITNATVVCDNKSTPTTILDDANDKVTNVSGNDTYYVYFEVTNNSVADGQGVLHDGYVDVKFTENTTNSNVTWRMGVDDNSSNSTFGGSESLEGGEELTIDLYNTMSGKVHSDINETRLTDGASWNPVIAVSNGTAPENYTMYFDNLTVSSGNWWYYAYDGSDDLQLKRNQSTSDASTLDDNVFNVGKLSGNVAANLNATGTIEVTSDFEGMTNLSSETEHPNTDNTPDYNQYFEADSSSPTTTDYYINATMVDSSFSTAGNNFTINSTYLGWSNLTVEKTGVVVAGVVKIGIDKSKDGSIGPNNNDSYTVDFAANRTYHLFTTPGDANVSVLFFNASGAIVLNLTENLSAAGTHYNNVSKLQGRVPSDLDGKTVEVETSSGLNWNDGSNHSYAMVNTASDPNYVVYFNDTASGTYYALFGKTNKVLEKSFPLSGSGNTTVWKNVSKVNGTVHPSLGTPSDVNDTFSVYNDSGLTKAVSSETNVSNTSLTPNYEVYYETTNGSASYYLNATANDGTGNYTSHVNFTCTDVNESVVYNIDDRLNGTVPNGTSLVMSISIDNGSDGNWDSYTNSFNATGYYMLFINATGSANVSFYRSADMDSDVLLWGDKSFTNATFDVARINGSIDTNFSSGIPGSVNVYTDWADDAPTGQLNNVSFVTGGNEYEVFIDVTTPPVNVDVNFTDETGYRSWAINVTDSTDNAINGSDQVAYNATTLIHGDTPLDSGDRIAVKNVTNTTLYAIGISLTSNGTYRIYTANQSGSINFHVYNDTYTGGTLQLNRTSDDNLNSSETFNVGKVSGDVHTNLKTGDDDLIDVYGDRACTATQLSSEIENPTDAATPDYTQYFEADAAIPTTASYYINASMVDSGNTYSAVGTVFTIPDTMAKTMPLDTQLNGSIPADGISATDTDIGNVTLDINADYDYDVATTTVHFASTDCYYLWFNSSLGSADDVVRFYNTTGTTLLLNRTVNTTDNNTLHVGKVMGEAHSYLEDNADDDVKVYDGLALANQLNSEIVHPQDAAGASEDYEVFYNQSTSAVTGAILKITDEASSYISYHRFNWTHYNETIIQNISALKYGNVTEEAHSYPLEDVSVKLLNPGGSYIYSNTTTLTNGTYRLFTSNGTYDVKFEKIGYVTQTNSSEVLNSTVDNPNNISMQYVVKLWVQDPSTNPPEINATVTVINSTGAPSSNELYRTKVNNYDNESKSDGTYYYYNINPSIYPNISIIVKSEDPRHIGYSDNNGGSYYSVSNTSQQVATSPYKLKSVLFAITIDTYNKTVKGGGQITFIVDNNAGYTGTQLNVSLDVSGLNASNTVYATDGDSNGRYTVTITVDNTTTGTKTVTATAINNDSVTVTAYIEITIVGASIAIEPSSGGYSTTVYVNGSGFRPHELVTVDFGSTPDIATCYATSAGIINTTFTVDVQPAGNTTVCARGSYTYDTATFDITGNATITAVSPKYGPVGTDVTVSGVGYGAYENVTIDFGATSTITYAYTDAGGGFTARFMVDAQTEGTKTIWANGTTTGESATESFEIRSQPVIIITPRWETGQDKIVSGSVTIEIDAPLPTYLVEFRITNDSGTTWYNLAGSAGANTTDNSAPWSQTWDTTMFDDAASCTINITAKAKNDTSYYVIGYASLAGITVDNTNPAITINSPTSSTDYRKAGDFVDVNFTHTEVNLKRWEIRIYNNTLGTIGYASDTSLPTSPATIPVLIYHAATSGYYNISVTLYDKVGNSNVSYSNNSVKVDSTLPTITSPTPTGITGDDTPWINATLVDTGGSGIDTTSVRLTLDGTKVAATVTTTKVSYEVPSSLVNGTHTVSLYVADNASNWNLSVWSFTVDTDAPSVEITNPNSYDYITGNITLRAAVSDTFSGVQNVSFYNDTTLIGTDTSSADGWTRYWDTVALALNGTYTLTAKAYDNVGNTVTSAPIVVYVDNAAPSVTVDTITSPTSGTIQINATTSDTDWDHVDFEYSTDNATWYAIGSDYTSGAWSVYWDTTAVADGTTYYVNATATDNAGLNGTDTEGPFKIDNTAPVVNITSPTPGDVVNGTITVTYTVTDASSTTNTSSIDGSNPWKAGGLGSFTNNTNYLVDGAHTVRVKSVDALGNTGYSTYVLFIVDNGAPEAVYIEYPAYSCYVAGNLTIKAAAADSVTNVSYIEFYNDSTLIGTDTNKSGGWSYTWNTSNTSDGYHNLSVIAYDQEGNNDSSPDVFIIVDNTAPTVLSFAINNNDTYTNTRLVNLSFSVTDDDSPIYLSLSNDNNNWTAWFSYIENMQWILPSGDGTKTVYFLASDIVDNYAAGSDTIILDTTAPVLTITSPTAGSTVSGSTVNITFTGREYDVHISIDGAAPYIDTNGADWHIWNTTAISNGTHTLEVKDNDTAGNIGYSNTIVVTVDNSKPYAQIWLQPSANVTYDNGIYLQKNVTLRVSAFDPFGSISNVTFYYDGNNEIGNTSSPPWNEVSQVWNVSGLGTGTHTVYVIVKDDQGNSFSTINITVYTNRDTKAPTVQFVNPIDGQTGVTGLITVQINATDTSEPLGNLNVIFRVTDDQGVKDTRAYATTYNSATGYYENSTSSFNASEFANGTTLIMEATANDSAGNENSKLITFNVTSTTQYDKLLQKGWRDLTLPQGTITGSHTVQNVTTSINGTYDWIFYYNITSYNWPSYLVGRPANTLTEIYEGRQYWINMTAIDRFYI